MLCDVLGAVRRLPRNGRQALLQSQIEGCSHREIAHRTGVSIGTVKSRISRSRTMLAQLLDVPRLPAAPPRPVLQALAA